MKDTNDNREPTIPVGSTALVGPSRLVSEDMVNRATYGTDDPWHIAANLNAMMELGYCKKCGLVPVGCEREGCGPTTEVNHGAKGQK